MIRSKFVSRLNKELPLHKELYKDIGLCIESDKFFSIARTIVVIFNISLMQEMMYDPWAKKENIK